MKLQILHVPDCPNVAVLAARLDEVLADRGGVEVERRVIADQDEAVAAGMTGSPTLLVDGTDPFAMPDSSASVSCRLYIDETGAAVGSPSVAQLRAVVAGQRPPTQARDGLTLGRWRAAGTGERQAVLPGALRSLHQAVLRHFLTNGDPPDRNWMQQQARAIGLDPHSANRQLTAADLVHVGGDGAVLVAYPFSGVPSAHRVQLADGPAVWAMCAIDALGIPQMADRDATIIATDPSTGDEVRVETHAGRWRWAPATTTVLVAQTGANGPSAACTCGHVNFYGRAEIAQAYLDEHPELTGRVLDASAAVELAGQVFGALLHNPV